MGTNTNKYFVGLESNTGRKLGPATQAGFGNLSEALVFSRFAIYSFNLMAERRATAYITLGDSDRWLYRLVLEAGNVVEENMLTGQTRDWNALEPLPLVNPLVAAPGPKAATQEDWELITSAALASAEAVEGASYTNGNLLEVTNMQNWAEDVRAATLRVGEGIALFSGEVAVVLVTQEDWITVADAAEKYAAYTEEGYGSDSADALPDPDMTEGEEVDRYVTEIRAAVSRAVKCLE